MKYEITDEQMETLVYLHWRLLDIASTQDNELDNITLTNLAFMLRGLIEHTEMQDIEDVLEITPDGELAFQLKLDI